MHIARFNAPYLISGNIDDARAWMDKGCWSEACWVLRSSLEAEPGQAMAWLLLAECSRAMGLEGEASDYLLRAKGMQAPSQDACSPFQGVFIGGTGRSGTSLLRRILGSHPGIALVAGETKCISDEQFRLAPHWFHSLPKACRVEAVGTLKSLWHNRFYCYVQPHKATPSDDQRRGFCLWLGRKELDRELIQLDALVEAESLHEIEHVWGKLYAALFRKRAEEQDRSLWIEKTPNNALYARYLHSWLPGVRLLNIVRDGRDVACSMQNVSWGQKDLVKSLDWWAGSLAGAAFALQTLPRSWSLTLRYEDLVTVPEETLNRVADFLGIKCDFSLDMFSSSVQRWKTSMPTNIQEYALSKYEPLFKAYGYDTGCYENDAEGVSAPVAGNFEMKKRNDCIRYVQDMLRPIMKGKRNVSLYDLVAGENVFALRHDVDNGIDVSMQMAQLEYKNDLRATYFLLPPSPFFASVNYYGRFDGKKMVRNPRLADYAKFLLDKGHYVGLHNNIAELAVFMHRSLRDVLSDEINFFEQNGINLAGTAGHGSPFFHDNDFVSCEIFEEGLVKPGFERGRVVSVNGSSFRLHSLSLADFGLSYEAYSLPHDFYLSDSGQKWSGSLITRSRHPELPGYPPQRFLSAFGEVMSGASEQDGSLQILIHPEHWMIG